MRLSKNEIVKVRRRLNIEEYVDKVRDILYKVRREGDKAIIEITEKIDKIKIEKIEIGREYIRNLSSKVSQDIKDILKRIVERIWNFNAKLLPKNEIIVSGSEIAKLKYVPIERVGIYIPRGYISTLIMLTTIAKVSGCEDIVVFTPPINEEYLIQPEMAYILELLKIYRVYVGNGVAGIGALAYGTETIPKVFKIYGPGNIYIQSAKYLVSSEVDIDGIEGPTELVLYVDDTVSDRDIKCAILDVIAELEHGVHSIAIVLSNSENILNMFEVEYRKAKENLENIGELYTVKIDNLEDVVNIINEIAPEHVEIISKKYREISSRITNAGIISINTPCTYLDYSAGPCHVLPTSGFAKSRGTITPLDFMKKIIIYEGYSIDMLNLGQFLAKIENMKYHEESLRCRLV